MVKRIFGEEDQNGMRVVWQPERKSEIVADIVAVHGLASGSTATYRHENGTSLLEDLWAHDDELPDIRILTFGYNALDVYSTSARSSETPTGRLMTFAEQLCFDLRNIRTELEQERRVRPIVFVGHGIGGLVIKKALTDHKDILQCTSHVFFFDTPHNGFDFRAWNHLTGQRLTAEAQTQFKVQATPLSELARGFGGIRGSNSGICFTTFYVPDPTQSKDLESCAIRESSSVLSIPEELPCSLDRVTHLTMLKYGSCNDSGYKRIRDRLRVVLQRPPLGFHSSALISRNENLVAEKHRITSPITLKWLSSYDYESIHYRVAAMRKRRTAEWILREAEFKSWFEGPQSSCMWCYGNVGVGKSVISSKIVDFARSSPTISANGIVIHVYCQHGERDALNTTSLILNSLLKQLLVHLEFVGQPTDASTDEKLSIAQRQGRNSLSSEEAWEIVLSLARKFAKMIIVIDGLDECCSQRPGIYDSEDEAIKLLKLVQQCLQRRLSTAVKFFLSSRMDIDVRKSIPSSMVLLVSQNNVSKDIEVFVEEEVEDKIWAAGRTDDKELLDDIKKELIIGAQGMFLWAKLQIQALCEDCISDTEFREAIEHLPTSIHEIYHRCVLRILRRQRSVSHAKRLLQWICLAQRPLHIDELKEAITIEKGDLRWDDSDSPKWRIATSTLMKAAGGLVYLDEIDNLVRLVHPSVKQYLFLGDTTHEVEDFCFEYDPTNLLLGKACLTYLFFQDFITQVAKREEGRKFREMPAPDPLAFVDTLPQDSMTLNLVKAIKRPRSVSPRPFKLWVPFPNKTTSTNHASWKYKLLDYARDFWAIHTKNIEPGSPMFGEFKRLVLQPNEAWSLQPWLNSAAHQSYEDLAFEWALNNEHIPVLSLMPEFGKGFQASKLPGKLLKNGRLAVHHAAAEGYAGVLRYFCSLDPFAFQILDLNKFSALHHAVSRGQASTTWVLMNIPRLMNFGWSNQLIHSNKELLTLAVKSGNPDIVRILLGPQEDRSKCMSLIRMGSASFESQHVPLLVLAASMNYDSVIRELLLFGSDDLTASIFEPLQLTVACRHLSSASVLADWALNHGLDFDPQDILVKDAAESDAPEMLNTLLAFRTDEQLRRLITSSYLVQLVQKNRFVARDTFIQSLGHLSVHLDHILRDTIALPHAPLDLVEQLLGAGASVNAKCPQDQTPLWLAVSNGHVAIASYLLRMGASKEIMHQGQTLEGKAVSKGVVPMIQLLLENGANPDGDSFFFDHQETLSLLTWAVLRQRHDIAQTLLEYRANVNRISASEAPLARAIEVGDFKMVDFLLQKGADVRGSTILSAVNNSLSFGSGLDRSYSDIMSSLLQAGFDLNQTRTRTFDSMSLVLETPLVSAVRCGKLKRIEFLVKHGAHINEKNKNLETPLMNAVQSNQILAATHLLKLGAAVNEIDCVGKTALDYAHSPKMQATVYAQSHRRAKTGKVLQKEKDILISSVWYLFSAAGLCAAGFCWGLYVFFGLMFLWLVSFLLERTRPEYLILRSLFWALCAVSILELVGYFVRYYLVGPLTSLSH